MAPKSELVVPVLAQLVPVAIYVTGDKIKIMTAVKPPNKGHIGDKPVVPCREVVLFSEVSEFLLNLLEIS